MYLDYPFNEDRPAVSGWLKLVIGLVLGLTLVTGLILLNFSIPGAMVLLAGTLLDGFLFYSLIPRRYQIYSDRLKIVLGQPFSMTLFYQDIRSVSQVESGNALASTGFRFATSTRYVVEIIRPGKMSVTISPAGGDRFLEQLKLAMKNYKGLH